MNEMQATAMACLPGGLRAAAGRYLDDDEQVRHALLLAPAQEWGGDGRAADGGDTALVVTDRRLLVLEAGPRHLPSTLDNVAPRLACPLDAILAVECGHMLLTAWVEITAIVRGALQRTRLSLTYEQEAAVRAFAGALVGPVVPPSRADDPDQRLLAEVPALLRHAADRLLAPGERAVIVLCAPPAKDAGRGTRRPRSHPEDRPVRAVVATESKVVLLEQPPPVLAGGMRFGLVGTVCPLRAVEDVRLVAAVGLAATARVRLGYEGVGFDFDLDLARSAEQHWSVPLAALAAMRRRPTVTPLDAERRRFVLATGLGQVEVTEPSHYGLLLRHVEEHHRTLRAQGRQISLAEAARDWCHSVYEPIAVRLKAGRARLRLPDRTLADLYVRLCEHKWLVSERARRDIGLDAALQDFERWAG